MNRDAFSTPANSSKLPPLRSTVRKRDTLAAELERDPQTSTAKRQQRTQTFTSHMAHASLERQLVAAQAAKVEAERKLREQEVVVERLERDRRWLAEREEQERLEKEKERLEYDEEKRKADHELRTLRNTIAALREEHADLQDAHDSLSRSTSQSTASQRAQIVTLTRQISTLESKLAEAQHLATERALRVSELREEVDAFSAAQDKSVHIEVEAETWNVLREELHRQAGYTRTLEATNAKLLAEINALRERQTSVEVLREQKRELERKVVGADQARESVVRLEAELEAARKEREEWAKKATEPAVPAQTPVTITQSLTSLRLAHAKLLEEHGADLALLHRREAELAELTQRAECAEGTVQSLRKELADTNARLGRREHRTILAEREVDFLQALLSSFQAEEASQLPDTATFDEAKSQRIQHLEHLLKDFKATNDQLQRELDTLGGEAAATSQQRSRELEEELAAERSAREEADRALEDAEAASETLVEKIEELEQDLFELRGEIGAGHHVPPGVRVLSLHDNPAQRWEDLRQEAMDRLKSENEALIQRLKALEEGGARGAPGAEGEDLVPRASWEAVQKEKEELQESLKQREKRLMRLQEIFKAKSTEFREAIASILGVKLAFYPNGQVRVTSQYDLTASFVFQPERAGSGGGARMQLVAQGEGGPPDLEQWMRNWVEDEQCIPGFLATVTLECYDRAKREGTLLQ